MTQLFVNQMRNFVTLRSTVAKFLLNILAIGMHLHEQVQGRRRLLRNGPAM